MTARRAAILLAAVLAAAAAATAGADELVTRDGQVIVTDGPWEVRGKLLVFKLADGTLASLRLDEADLEATERRARAAEERAQRAREVPARPEPERQAVLVLTDRDVAHASDPVDEPGADDGEGEPGAGGEQGASGQAVANSGRSVQVVQWSQEADGDTGLSVRGVVQNLGSSIATRVTVNALFYDEAGGLVAAREVTFEDEPLRPGERRNFSVSLPHSLVWDEIKFQVVGSGFRSVGQSVRAQPAAASPEGDAEEPETP